MVDIPIQLFPLLVTIAHHKLGNVMAVIYWDSLQFEVLHRGHFKLLRGRLLSTPSTSRFLLRL